MADTLAVEEHAAQAQLHGHVDDVLRSQVVVVVVFLFAIAEKPVDGIHTGGDHGVVTVLSVFSRRTT